MPDRHRPRQPAAPIRRKLDVACAVATEELLEAHSAHIMELIGLADGRVAPERMIDIYLRLQGIGQPHAMVVRTRVLAALGQRTRSAPEGAARSGPVEEIAPPPPRGIFSLLRERFRGRVHTELRRWVELHTGRAAMALLDIHVRNALAFVDVMGAEAPLHQGVETYCEMLGVADSFRDVLYWMVLERIARAELPRTGTLPLPRAGESAPAAGRRPRLRPPYRTA